jgi:HSP90 family molecular chaperone
MLKKFFSEFEAAVEEYSDVLKLIVEIATDQHEPDVWREREQEVDAAIAKFDAKFDLFSTELMAVSEFLTRVQADREEPVKCADYTGDSAHWIAALAFSHTSETWKKCKETRFSSCAPPAYRQNCVTR